MKLLDVTATVCAVLLLLGCSKGKQESRERPPRLVLTADVEVVDQRDLGPFTGKVEARFKTGLGFRIAGRVVTRKAQIGATVKAGDPLAELDPTQERLNLASADADVADGEAEVENTQSDLDRKSQLRAKGDLPQAELDLVRAAHETSVARLNALKATQQKARENLTYTVLRAEFDGVVTGLETEVGQQVQAGQSVVDLVRPDVREAVVDIPADLMRDVPSDASFVVALAGDASVKVDAHVRETGPLADAQTRTQRLRLSLSAVPETFRLGSTVQITLRRAVKPQTRVPIAAILEQDGSTFVWTVQNNTTVDRRPVTVTSRDGATAIIDGDLKPNARVVVAGLHSLKAGQSIRIAADEP